jgi:hypothetical protein
MEVKEASRRCGALRETGSMNMMHSSSCHVVGMALASAPACDSCLSLSRSQRKTHSALARTTCCSEVDREWSSSTLAQSSGRRMMWATWRICSLKSEKSWFTDCNRGRVDAGWSDEDCDTLARRQMPLCNTDAYSPETLAPSCHVNDKLWLQQRSDAGGMEKS